MHKFVSAVSLMLLAVYVEAATLPADPTRPAVVKVQSSAKSKAVAQDYILNSLLMRKHKSVAVVNGQRVSVGDQVGGAKVLAISAKGVRLRVGNEQRFISLAKREGFSKVKSGK